MDAMVQERKFASSLEAQIAALAARQAALDEEEHRLLNRQAELLRRAEEVGSEHLAALEAALHQKTLELNGERELSRREIHAEWERLQEAQRQWRHRRDAERSLLKHRFNEVERGQRDLLDARRYFATEEEAGRRKIRQLETECDGLETRVQNLRVKLVEQTKILQNPTTIQPVTIVEAPKPLIETPSKGRGKGRSKKGSEPKSTLIEIAPNPQPSEHQGQVMSLADLAGQLQDQRRHLIEFWQRLLVVHRDWEQDRAKTVAEMDAIAHRLDERDRTLDARETDILENEQLLQEHWQELARERTHLVGWQARLRTQERELTTWQQQQTASFEQKEALAEQSLSQMLDLRKRWTARRHQEIERFNRDLAFCDQVRQECAKLRADLTREATSLQQQKAVLAEKTLALEQYRVEVLRQGDDHHGERLLEQLRRRWLSQHAELIQATLRERDALSQELAGIDEYWHDLKRRAETVEQQEATSTEQLVDLEHREAMASHRWAGQQRELEVAQIHRRLAEAELIELRQEIDRIAGQLLEEPDPPEKNLRRAA